MAAHAGMTAAHAVTAKFLRGCWPDSSTRPDVKASRAHSTRAREPPGGPRRDAAEATGHGRSRGSRLRPSGSPQGPRSPTPTTRPQLRAAAGSALPPTGPGLHRLTSQASPPRLVAVSQAPVRRATPGGDRTDADRRFLQLRFEKCSRVWDTVLR